MKKEGSTGQIFSAELTIASAFIVIALIAVMALWTHMGQSYAEEELDYQMQVALIGVSDMMVLSPGEPTNWEASAMENASAFGLASSPNKLSSTKLSKFSALNASKYQIMKERMGAGSFDVYIKVYNSTVQFYAFGLAPSANDSRLSIASVERLAILNESTVNVKVQLWRIRGRLA